MHVAVLGAGAFGGWTALHLLRRGARVTLLDAWGPGNSRSSSGGETRIIRGVYGPDRIYVDWTARAFGMWQEAERRWGRRLLHQTGALWMMGEDESYVRDSLPFLADAGLPVSEIPLEEARSRFPQIDFHGVRSVFLEEKAGYLLARRACQAVAEAVAAEGGEVRIGAAVPGPPTEGGLRLVDGSTLQADLYVFACGPWLGEMFPEVIGDRLLRPTRQEIFFFGLPPGDPWFHEERCPVWLDLTGERIFYGIPGNENRGFKVADDTPGPPFDPTDGPRDVTPAGVEAVRAFLARRFPALAGAPLLGSEVCQYEASPDSHFIIDRHPAADNVWIAGGGSGHGFKMGPAIGERVASHVLSGSPPDPQFALARLAATPPGGWEHKWS